MADGSGFFGGVGSSGQNVNPANSMERAFGTDGAGFPVVSSATANTAGNWTTIYTTTNDWSKFLAWLGPTPNSARYMVDISLDGGTTTLCQKLLSGAASTIQVVWEIDIPIPAGSVISMRVSASQATAQTLTVALEGVIKRAADPPGFSKIYALETGAASGQPSSVDTTFSSDASPTWTQVPGTTARAYAGFSVCASSQTSPTQTQIIEIILAYGPDTSNLTIIGAKSLVAQSGSTFVGRPRNFYPPTAVPSGSKIWTSVRAAAKQGIDTLRVGVWGIQA
jgi:hypothetical protein